SDDPKVANLVKLIASLLRDRFLTLLADGGRDLDWSAVGALAGGNRAIPSRDRPNSSRHGYRPAPRRRCAPHRSE
ncbi:hypothetical protein C6A85_70755, partial [Mycobacterium sp. ITM-2017-0098]